MESERLQKLIASLHEELSSSSTVDDQTRALLKKLTQDIENIDHNGDSAAGQKESIANQMEETAVKFETDHPKLSMALGEIVDALGKLGI